MVMDISDTALVADINDLLSSSSEESSSSIPGGATTAQHLWCSTSNRFAISVALTDISSLRIGPKMPSSMLLFSDLLLVHRVPLFGEIELLSLPKSTDAQSLSESITSTTSCSSFLSSEIFFGDGMRSLTVIYVCSSCFTMLDDLPADTNVALQFP